MANGDRTVVYIGDVGDYLYEAACQNSKLAILITQHNYQNLVPGVYYTSLGNFDNLNAFAAVLRQADDIIYVPPKIWSDESGSLQAWTEDYLTICSCDNAKTVSGFDLPDPPLTLITRLTIFPRAADTTQVWVAGCSISHGVGVTPEQRFGHIVAERLDLPVSFLTRPGSSIVWAADQILKSDIRKGDYVFWGLTGVNRFTYWNDQIDKLRHCTMNAYPAQKKYLDQIITKNFFVSGHIKYQALTAVHQVVNFCKQIDARLIIATLMPGIEIYLKDLKNFVPLSGLHGRELADQYTDQGSDGVHPGPNSHVWFANCLIDKLNTVYGTSY